MNKEYCGERIVQIIEPKEMLYNVYSDDGVTYDIYPVEYLGLTERGFIVGIELNGKGGYGFYAPSSFKFLFTTNKTGLKSFSYDKDLNWFK